jgi:hypothetical protein
MQPYIQVKTTTIQKHNTHVNKFFVSKDFSLPYAHQVEIMCYSISKLEIKLCSYPWETKIY